MVTFYPVWTTLAGALTPVTENDLVSQTLAASRKAKFMGDDSDAILAFGNTIVHIGPSVSFLTEVQLNSQSLANTAYTLIANAIEFHNALSNTDVVDLTTSEPISYSMLHDNLPPGLSLSSTGEISGKVGVLPTDGPSLTYSFAVRISDGTYSRDRSFSIEADPATVQAAPPSWGSLPPEQTQQAQPSAFDFVPIGATTRGTPFVYQIAISQPGGLPPTLVVETFIGATDIVSPFNTLPPGLSVDPHTGVVSGTIAADAQLGKYFFTIEMLDNRGNPITTGSGATPKTFMIEISPPFSALEPLRFILWVTPAGLLATLPEAQAFPIGVRATCTTGEPVVYSLASNNSPLPPGLSLNTATGDIEGILAHIPADQTFTFTIRAQVSDTFQDRQFSIKVLSRYSVETFFNMTFKVRVKTTTPLTTYYSSVINAEEYFRQQDPNYGPAGVTSSMSIFLAGGLQGNASVLEQTVRASNLDGPVKLRLGDHKIAFAKIDGVVIYEVLYREVVDPLEHAGGWTVTDGVPVESPVRYPQSTPSNTTFIHPSSINNIRAEFVNALGFPALDPTETHDMSLKGPENLPLWMTCPQTGTDASTALGYIPAVVLAYLQPGTGQGVLDRISLRSVPAARATDSSDPVRDGHEVEFDQYFMIFQTMGIQTTFDGATTTFDQNTVRLDTLVFTEGKFFRMNRAKFNTTST
jgi:hypothetical protein